MTIEATSIDTRNEQRDGHLRTNDFFDVPNHPQLTYRFTSVEPLDDEHFRTLDLEHTGERRTSAVQTVPTSWPTSHDGQCRLSSAGVSTQDLNVTVRPARVGAQT